MYIRLEKQNLCLSKTGLTVLTLIQKGGSVDGIKGIRPKGISVCGELFQSFKLGCVSAREKGQCLVLLCCLVSVGLSSRKTRCRKKEEQYHAMMLS